jgi:hypothetical protein
VLNISQFDGGSAISTKWLGSRRELVSDSVVSVFLLKIWVCVVLCCGKDGWCEGKKGSGF